MKKTRRIKKILRLLRAWDEYKKCSGRRLPNEKISSDFIFEETPSGFQYWANIDKVLKQIK